MDAITNNSDIQWRNIKKDHSVFLPENQDRQILVETETALDFSLAKYVCANHYLKCGDEEIIRYAFID